MGGRSTRRIRTRRHALPALLAIVTGIGLVLPSAAAAADVTVGFDDLAPGVAATTQYRDTGGANRGVELGLGPPFGAEAGSTWTIVKPPTAALTHSAPNVAAASACPPPRVYRLRACGSDLWARFPFTKQRVSLYAGFAEPQATPVGVVLEVYDGAGSILATQSATVPAGQGVVALLSVTRPSADIAYIRVHASDSRAVAVDDLVFDNPTTPPPPDFSFKESPLLRPDGLNGNDIVQGETLDLPINVARVNGSNGPVSFSAGGFTFGLTGSVEPQAVGGAGTSTVRLRLAAASNAIPGTANVLVRGAPQTAGVGPAPHDRFVPIRVLAKDLYDARVIAMEVTQGIQYQTGVQGQRPTAPGAAVPYSGVPLARDGKTIVRAWANNASPIPTSGFAADVVLYGTGGNGAPLPGSPILPIATPTKAFTGPGGLSAEERAKADSAAEFVLPYSWTRGRINLRAAVSGPDTPTLRQCDGCTGNDSLTVSGVAFTPMRTLELHPISFNDNFSYPAPATKVFAGAHNLFPVPIDDRGYYDMSFEGTPYANISDRSKRSSAVANAVGDWESDHPNNFGKQIPVGVAGFDVGVTVGGDKVAIDGRLDGQNNNFPADGQVFRPLTSIAHELGHVLGRPHASGCNGGNSNGQSGEDWAPDQQGWIQGIGIDRTGAGASKAGFLRMITLPGPSLAKLGFTGNAADATDEHWFDFMSYCAFGGGGDPNSWTSARGWADVFNRWSAGAAGASVSRSGTATAASAAPRRLLCSVADAGNRLSPAAGGGAWTGATRAASPRVVARAAAGKTLKVAGYLDGGRFVISWLKPGREAARFARGGPYELVTRDAAGRVVGSAPLGAESGHGDRAGGVTVYAGEVRAAGAERLDVTGPGGASLATATRSAHAPRIRLLSPRRGARVGGRRGVIVSWLASDRDGDRLKVYVEYSRNGGRRWQTISIGSNRGRLRLPSSYLARSRNARVRLRANDGFNETTVVSSRFTALGAPPIVAISSPAPRTVLRDGSVLALAGQGHDDTGARLRHRSLRWLAGRTLLGTGEQVAVATLPPGARRVTLIARDRYGRTGRATVGVRIRAAAPVLLRVSGPRRLSRRARRVTIVLAAAPDAVAAIGRQRFRVGRRARRLGVKVRPGRSPLVLRVKVTSGGRSVSRTLRIPRA